LRKIKIGIDVGGTFTHAVAVDIRSLEIVGKVCLPTTHTAKEGVARGVVDVTRKLLSDANINPDEVVLIAHSTTQATNALLEGDVAPVGIIGMGSGVEGLRAKNETNPGDIDLTSGKFIKTYHRFLDTSKEFSEEIVLQTIQELVDEGAQAIVASESFGVDDPTREEFVVRIAIGLGLPATASSSISQLYGLRIRTRTAVINASMLPKMLETANMTERSIRASGIKAPLMVMRSDGGIMDINEMRRRPILTILSGPAAGVAAALMYVKISDGIFLEVGGTSTDISAIKNGKPLVKSAKIGRHKLYLRTLDIRTIGVAGGSMVRVSKGKVADVGPRSAHIAGLKYVSFSNESELDNLQACFIQPKHSDPEDYLALKRQNTHKPTHTVTPTAASNILGLVSEHGYCRGNLRAIRKAFGIISQQLSIMQEKLAEDILKIASSKAIAVIENLIKEYKLDRNLIALVGGGGGAEAIVPYTAQRMNLNYKIAENTEVVSAIGAALGIIQDTIERTIIDPTVEDIIKIRTEAAEAVQRMGAVAETIEVTVGVDRQTKRVTAIATGSSEFRAKELRKKALTADELQAIVVRSMGVNTAKLAGQTNLLKVFSSEVVAKRFFGIVRSEKHPVRVIGEDGVIRLQLSDAKTKECKVAELSTMLAQVIDELTMYGDAGALLPEVYLVCGGRIIDMTGLIDKRQMLSVSEVETEKMSKSDNVVIITAERR